MNIIFNEIKQFIVKRVNKIEYICEHRGYNQNEIPVSVYIDKLETNKKYLIIEFENNNIAKIIYPGKFIELSSIDADEMVYYLFSIDKYYNYYYNSYNYQYKDDIINNDKKNDFDYDIFENNSKSNNFYYDLHEINDDSFLDFLFFELEDNFDENKLFEILQFCIDNTKNTENFLCVNNEYKLLEIYRFYNQNNKVFTDKIDYNNIFNKRFEINFKL